MPELQVPASAGGRQRAHLAVPPVGDGPYPGVVVLQDALGATADLRAHTERLATAGYLAVAPALYTARGGGPRCIAGVMRSMRSGSGPVFDDIEAVRSWLAARDDCTGTIGVIGFCQGGGFALLSAARHDYAAAAPNYGMLPDDPERDLAGICPTVASFGARDPILKGAGPRLESALDRLGVENDVRTYDEAGHSFLERGVPGVARRLVGFGHHGPSAEDAWGRILRFFDTHLRAGPRDPEAAGG
ncbi:dienelactone hydrolase family protein [Pseudonocardia sp. HH130630-07]|uniref:dienelactone hydrolase family protein n=1 Tax=Pseudonocardia sp. HH130630-07 TaxID=1690815 RepID=UPI000814CCB1|nr:dienelactone hydrolase family protein [Pseudonocardia sp. HH130630-07]ANY06648.1 carboxymethylenebutenolidase [Pseudonocardia sp. HH130630-07]